MDKNWYTMKIKDVISELQTTQEGLTESEVRERQLQYGYNELKQIKKITPLGIFLSQFKNFLIIILLCAVVVSALIGETVDAMVIAVIVLFCTILGFIQEYRAERALEALKRMASRTASVLRDGKETEVAASVSLLQSRD
jgi:Ca2+-transporting ATPase